MAAGVGSRISRHLHGQPKCCVDVGGVPLIRRTFELLNKKGFNDIAIVTGYAKEYVDKALEGFTYTSYTNPFYRVTNSIASAWFAQEFIDVNDELIILNGDLFFEEKLLDILIKEKKSPVMLSDSSRIEDADYRFNWDGEFLKRYGKELSNDETTGEYVGIGKFSKDDVLLFKTRVLDFIDKEDYNCWWEDVIYSTIQENKKVYINDIKGIFWAEVDYIEDYERIIKYLEG